MATQIRPAAVLWDYDGTLLDTERTWIRSETELLADYGLEWTYEQGLGLVGSSWQVTADVLLEAIEAGQGTRPAVDRWEFYSDLYQRVRRQVQTGNVPWLPGVAELLAELRGAGVPMAVVSASPRDLVMAGVDQMPEGTFATIVCGTDIPRGKPEPDGYLLAAENLGVAAGNCIVIEDSVAGTTAGRAAGAAVIGVPCLVPLPEHDGQVLLDSLDGVGLVELTEIWQRLNGGGND